MTIVFRKPQKWLDKGIQPNMKEVTSAQDLVESFLSAGDKLVVVDFFSPGCGGCKTLHPKIKKFKDALAKYGTDRCTLGPPKGLEEKELLALAANKDLSFNYTPKTEEPVLVTSQEEVKDTTTPNVEPPPLPLPLPITSASSQTAKRDTEKEAYATSGR